MKKIIKLTESDLHRIVEKVLNQTKLITEQTEDEFVEKIYKDIISAVETFGWTDKTKVYQSFDRLRNYDEFLKLYNKFKDKRTGYDSLKSMLEGEYDMFDTEDLKSLIYLFYNKFGVQSTFFKNPGELHLRVSFTFFPTTQSNEKVPNIQACKKNYEGLLEQSKKFWNDWLSNSETKRKFKRNYIRYGEKMNDSLVNAIFGKYKLIIDNSYLHYYYNRETSDLAFVTKSIPYRVHINCGKNDNDKVGTIIHEIQHLLYNFKPLNPHQQIQQVFVNSTTKRLKPDDIFGNISPEYIKRDQYIEKVSKDLSLPVDSIYDWYFNAEDHKTDEDPAYACRETEKMSNIFSVRNTLGIKPGQNITADQLKPYITKQKHQVDISWILICWAMNGFEDLNNFLAKLNDLAQKEFQKTNPYSIDMSQSGIDKA